MKFEKLSALYEDFNDVFCSEGSIALCYSPFILMLTLGRQTNAKSAGAATLGSRVRRNMDESLYTLPPCLCFLVQVAILRLASGQVPLQGALQDTHKLDYIHWLSGSPEVFRLVAPLRWIYFWLLWLRGQYLITQGLNRSVIDGWRIGKDLERRFRVLFVVHPWICQVVMRERRKGIRQHSRCTG